MLYTDRHVLGGKGALLTGASPLVLDMEKNGKVPRQLLDYYERLRLVEIRLGRLSPALRYHELYLLILSNLLDLSDKRKQHISKSHESFEICVLTSFLKTSSKDITLFEQFPDKLMQLELNDSGAALLYLLGGKKYISEVPETEEEIRKSYSSLVPTPAAWELPEFPRLYQEGRINMATTILGGDIILECDNNLTSIMLAESIIAGLEAMLPTFIQQKLLPKNEQFAIDIDSNPKKSDSIVIDILALEHNRVAIDSNLFEPHSLSKEQQSFIKKKIKEILMQVFTANYFLTKELVQSPDMIDALLRALNFSGSFLMLGNVSVHEPRYQPQNWKLSGFKNYSFVPEEKPRLVISNPQNMNSQFKRSPVDEDNVSQRDVSFTTVVNADLWGEAGMQGVAFGLFPAPKEGVVPFIAPLFTNAAGGRKIFSEWKSKFAEKISEKMTLCIVKGINEKNLGWYSVTFLPKYPSRPDRELKFVMSASHVSTSDSTTNLDAFIENYKKNGSCLLMPCFYSQGMSQPEIYRDLEFTFSNIIISDAWKVSPGDVAVCGLRMELTPYIPPSVKNAPVLETISLMKSKLGKK